MNPRRGNVLFLLVGAFAIVAIAIAGYFTWSRYITPPNKAPLTWEECLKVPGATMLMTYPGQCVTPDGRKVVQPLSEEEKKKLQPPDNINGSTESAGMTNWKTYVNNSYRFQIKYPADFYTKELGDGICLYQYNPTVPTSSHPIDYTPASSICIRSVSQKKQEINDPKWITSYKTGPDNQILESDISVFVGSVDIYKQIATTFQFLDQSLGPTPQQTTTGTGIEGKMMIWPNAPRCQTGKPCSNPYQGTVLVKSADRTQTITQFTANSDGTFKVTLLAGQYLLTDQNTGLPPTLMPQKVTVENGKYTEISIQFDSGIR